MLNSEKLLYLQECYPSNEYLIQRKSLLTGYRWWSVLKCSQFWIQRIGNIMSVKLFKILCFLLTLLNQVIFLDLLIWIIVCMLVSSQALPNLWLHFRSRVSSLSDSSLFCMCAYKYIEVFKIKFICICCQYKKGKIKLKGLKST